ncbi:MAG: 1-acyl-sn-glycerol-3-phosphate acyltransferase [Spirochaetes bacterium]|nr:1-acyl-sn-glycerol-3-phosphate acyltransferase [Spirochaetota bacterium]
MDLVIRYAKIFWIYFWAAGMTLILFVPVILASLLSTTGNLAFSITKIWARVMLLISAARVTIVGKEKIGKGVSYVIVSNHQSLFDILSLVTSLGTQYRWTIKKELLKIPLFGYALYASRNIFIDRSHPDKARESIRKGLDRLPAGVSVMFFPEGTRSTDGRLRDFKKGAFTVALERHYPILPVTVNGSRKVLPKGSIVFKPGRISVTVADPIETTGYDHDRMGELIEKTRAAVQSNLAIGNGEN